MATIDELERELAQVKANARYQDRRAADLRAALEAVYNEKGTAREKWFATRKQAQLEYMAAREDVALEVIAKHALDEDDIPF